MHLGEVGPWLEVLTSEDWTRLLRDGLRAGRRGGPRVELVLSKPSGTAYRAIVTHLTCV